MGKDVKAYDRDIQVIHDTGYPDNCKTLVGPNNHMFSIRVKEGTAGTPVSDEQGLLFYIDHMTEDAGSNQRAGTGTQYWVGLKTGRVYMRNTVGGDDWNTTTFHPWVLKSSSDKFMAKPELEPEISDANDLQYSGVFRTKNENPKTTNLPEGVNGWGVLQHYFENTGSSTAGATGLQLYAPITEVGRGFGNLYIRVFNSDFPLNPKPDGTKAEWKMLNISKIIDMQDKVFTYPTETATNINDKNANSYYVTNDSTLGDFPEGVNKHGIIKTLKTPAGYLRQTYTPLEGPYAGYNFTRVKERTVTRDGRNVDMWAKWQDGQSHVKIMNNRDAQVPNPSTYKAKATGGAGFIFHEWKFTSANGMGLPSAEQAERCILTTYVPTPSEEDTRTDFSDMVQFAFIKDGAVYKRNGSKLEDAWDTWKGIPVGQQPSGGGLTMTDITNMFTHWKTT